MNRREALSHIAAGMLFPCIEVHADQRIPGIRHSAILQTNLKIVERKMLGPCAWSRGIQEQLDAKLYTKAELDIALRSYFTPCEITDRLWLCRLPLKYQDEVDNGIMDLHRAMYVSFSPSPEKFWEWSKTVSVDVIFNRIYPTLG